MADDSSVIIESSEEEYEDVENADDENSKPNIASQNTIKWAKDHSKIESGGSKNRNQPELFIPSYSEAEIDFRTNFSVGIGPVNIDDLSNPKLTKWFKVAQDINIGFAKPENGERICGIIWLKLFSLSDVETCLKELDLMKDGIQVIRYNPSGPNFDKTKKDADSKEIKDSTFPSRVISNFKRIRLSRYPGRIVCVLNIPSTIDEVMIKEKIENALSVFIPKDYSTDTNKNYAYVEMPTVALAKKVVGTHLTFGDDEKYSIEKPWPITFQELLKKMEKLRKNVNKSNGFLKGDLKNSMEKLLKHAQLYKEKDYLDENESSKLLKLSSALKKHLEKDKQYRKNNINSFGNRGSFGKMNFENLRSQMEIILKRPQPLTGPMKGSHRIDLEDVLAECIYFIKYKAYSELDREKLETLQMQLEDIRERDDIRRDREAMTFLQKHIDIPMSMNQGLSQNRTGLLGPASFHYGEYEHSFRSPPFLNYNDSRSLWKLSENMYNQEKNRNFQKSPNRNSNWISRNDNYFDNNSSYSRKLHQKQKIIDETYSRDKNSFDNDSSGNNYYNGRQFTRSSSGSNKKSPGQKNDRKNNHKLSKRHNDESMFLDHFDYSRQFDYDEVMNRKIPIYADIYNGMMYDRINSASTIPQSQYMNVARELRRTAIGNKKNFRK